VPGEFIRVGDWALAARILAGAAPRVRRAIDQAVHQEALFLAAKIKDGLRAQAPGGQAIRPLAPSTLAVRRFKRFGGTKALLVRGDLRNSITVRREALGAFVGVLRSARNRSGAPLANVAELNEWGSRPIVIQVTPKMRRFLAAAIHAQGGHAGGARLSDGQTGGGTGIIVVQIPARPFIRPVVDQYYSSERMVADRFLGRVGRNLGGDFGGPGVRGTGSGGGGLSRVAGGGRARGGGLAVGWISRLFNTPSGGGGDGRQRDSRGRFT
jgi:hypothetical protein